MKGLRTEADREKLEKTIKELKTKTVIVEGKKDEKALKGLGVKDIVAINTRPLIHVVDKMNPWKTVVILTDFDKQGRKLAARLKVLLQRYKIRVNSRLRCMMMRFGKNKIEDFKEGDCYVKVSTNINKIYNKGSDKGKRGNRKT